MYFLWVSKVNSCAYSETQKYNNIFLVSVSIISRPCNIQFCLLTQQICYLKTVLVLMYNVINEMEFKIVQTATWILLLCSFCNGVPVQTGKLIKVSKRIFLFLGFYLGISDSFLVVGQKEFYFSLIIKVNFRN